MFFIADPKSKKKKKCENIRTSMGMTVLKMMIKCKVRSYHVHVPSLFWKLGLDLQAILMFRHEQVKRDIYK